MKGADFHLMSNDHADYLYFHFCTESIRYSSFTCRRCCSTHGMSVCACHHRGSGNPYRHIGQSVSVFPENSFLIYALAVSGFFLPAYIVFRP